MDVAFGRLGFPPELGSVSGLPCHRGCGASQERSQRGKGLESRSQGKEEPQEQRVNHTPRRRWSLGQGLGAGDSRPVWHWLGLQTGRLCPLTLSSLLPSLFLSLAFASLSQNPHPQGTVLLPRPRRPYPTSALLRHLVLHHPHHRSLYLLGICSTQCIISHLVLPQCCAV